MSSQVESYINSLVKVECVYEFTGPESYIYW